MPFTFAFRAASAGFFLVTALGCGASRQATPSGLPARAQGPSGGAIVYVAEPRTPGTEAVPDMLSEQMALRQRQFAPHMVPASPLRRGVLAQGQDSRFETTLEQGKCYRVIGVCGAGISDLDLYVVDENDNEIARDTAADSFPVLGLRQDVCPTWTGAFYIRALAYEGAGEYGVQLFSTP